jgi:predicted PurR-regulated permease PerM
MAQSGPHVPPILSGLAAISWRVLVVLALVAVVIYVLTRVQMVLLALFLAFLVVAVLAPLRSFLERRGVRHILATWAAFLAGVIGFLALLAAVIVPFALQAGGLWDNIVEGFDEVVVWLTDGPLGLPESTVTRYVEEARTFFEENARNVASGVVGTTMQGIEIITSVVLSLPIVFFLLKDSHSINRWLLGWVGSKHQERTAEIMAEAWDRVSMFVRGTALVAGVDAVMIGLGLFILGVPLWGALAVLTFVGGFIPIVGAFAAGIAAVLVTLVLQGLVDAWIVLGIVIAVQQLEGNVIAPLIVGRAVRLHPVVILLAISVGGTVGGIFGAFVAVPLTTFLYAIGNQVRRPRIVQLDQEAARIHAQPAERAVGR